jgi:hypothetical protein
MTDNFPKFEVLQGGRSLAPSGSGPHDPGMEARVSALETKIGAIESTVNRLEGQMGGLDTRLRGVEVSIGRLEGKIDALTGAIVSQTNAAIARLPTWWQIPAAVGATVVLLAGLIAGFSYLVQHGLM